MKLKLTSAMPTLSRDCYKAVRRALDNLWYGEDDPLMASVHWADRQHLDATRDEIVNALLNYYEIVIRAFADLPLAFEVEAATDAQVLRASILAYQQKLAPLRQEAESLRKPVNELHREVMHLRHEDERLKQQQRELEKRIANRQIAIATMMQQFAEACERDLRA